METVTKNSSNDVSDNRVVLSFVDALRKRLDKHLIELWLFGSHARGDYTQDSDYDMLVIAEGDVSQIKKVVLEEEYKLLIEKE